MKRTSAIIMCLIVLCLAVACNYENSQSESKTTAASKQDDLVISHMLTEEAEHFDYKKAYLELLKDKNDSRRRYALVFIDNDRIPELYISGTCEAEGDMIYGIRKGNVIQQPLNRIGGGRYIEKSGTLVNQNGNMGHYYTSVYKLNESGFTQTFNALSVEKTEHIKDEEYSFYYEYYVSDIPVSEADYRSAVNSAFDFSKAVRLDENAVTYDMIVQQLES